jgi:hypothetical protein
MKNVRHFHAKECSNSMMMIALVESSAVENLSWYRSWDKKEILAVWFVGNEEAYRYEDVPLETFVSLLNSESIGKALNELVIRPRREVAA